MSTLKDLLDETAGDAGVYDVTERALAGGRRRRIRQRLTAAGSAATPVAGGIVAIGLTVDRAAPPAPPKPASSVAPQACEVSRLPMPAGYGPQAAVSAADPTGRFLSGHIVLPPVQESLLLWDNGQVRALPRHG